MRRATVRRVDLFDVAADDTAAERAPLAVRMRPRTLDEVVGQDHLLVPGSPLRRLVDGVRAAVRRSGLPAEDRSYRPHLTLARAGSPPPAISAWS